MSDIDVVVAAEAGASAGIMAAFVAMTFVDHVLARGESKTSVVTRRGTQIDLRVVAPHQLGAARLYSRGGAREDQQASSDSIDGFPLLGIGTLPDAAATPVNRPHRGIGVDRELADSFRLGAVDAP